MNRGKRHINNNHTENQEINHNKDRLSDLPYCVLLHILSLLHIKQAVQTCILSTRWKNLWKHLPTLTLICSQFKTVTGFTEFVSQILSLRDDASTSLQTLEFRNHEIMQPCLLRRIIKYAVSYNVQRLEIYTKCDIQYFPTCLFSCHTLTSLDLCVSHPKDNGTCTLVSKSLNLPSLTNLRLWHCAFCVGDDGRVEPFSALTRLKSLTIVYCKVPDAHNLCISNTKLVNLKIYMRHCDPETYFGIKLSASCLCNFYFSGIPVQKHCGNNNDLSSIKHVYIDVISLWNSTETSSVLLNWLIELANIESLTVSSTTLEVFSLVPDLLKAQLPFLSHLKSLKVEKRPRSSIPYGIVDFFLKQSPSLKVDIIN